MLEIIGLITLSLLGLFLTVVGAAGFIGATVFGSDHKSDYGVPLATAVIGVAILCGAAYLSPFTITIEHAAKAASNGPPEVCRSVCEGGIS